MGFSQIVISNISVVKRSYLRKQIAKGGVHSFNGVLDVANGIRRLRGFGAGSDCVPSTGLVASGFELFNFSSSCWRFVCAVRQYFRSGLCFTRVFACFLWVPIFLAEVRRANVL